MAGPTKRFLTAEWRYLLMLNYAVDPALLAPHVPHGVDLDHWNGTAFVSMVGFIFQRTRVRGVAWPLHVNFEEVNLRFYVRRKTPEGWRRGVVFIREIVPRRIIATIARVFYNEPYLAMPMRHTVDVGGTGLVEYGWRFGGCWNFLRGTVSGNALPIREGSIEEFITEHYWGYTSQPNGGCTEYPVEHPRWNVWPAQEASFDCDIAALYGEKFVQPLIAMPHSAFVADGSPISVGFGAAIV